MKRLLILLFSLLVFSFSFSWEKIRQSDEFGDPTNAYMLGQKTNEGYGMMLVGGNENKDKICMFVFPNDNFPEKNITLKIKSKKGIETISGKSSGKYLFFDGMDAGNMLKALRDSNVVKFSFNGNSFSVSGAGFTKMYKEAYWKDFDLEKASQKPPKGEKAFSLIEGEGDIEAEDAIWD